MTKANRPESRLLPVAKRLGLAALAVVCLAAPGSTASAAEVIPRQLNERVEMIPVGLGWNAAKLETTLFVPPGPGPFPLVVINHGKAFGNPKFDPRARYPVASREFLRRGYLVAVPMRRGYSNSEGGLTDSGCNTESNGRMQGEEILQVLEKLLARPDVDKSRVLLVGQSYGGIAAIAAGAANPGAVKGILNFAGGIKRSEFGCLWEKALVDAFSAYGRESRIPSLWFYGDNDSYWGAELPPRMHAAYLAAGGKAKLVAYGKFDDGDAHGMFNRASGLGIWWPETEIFLQAVGLPTAIRFEVEPPPTLAPTDFAKIDDANAVPFLREHNREKYLRFLAKPSPRAFAVAANGAFGYAYGGDAVEQALSNCAQYAKGKECKVYALDDQVVWTP